MSPPIVPLLVPMVSFLVLALCNGWPRTEKVVSAVATLGLAAWSYWMLHRVDTAGVQAMVVGGWLAPWGVALVVDRLAAIMLCLSTSVGALVCLYTFNTVSERQQRYFFYPLLQIVLLGVNWSFVSGDLFNLFVAFEVMLIGSYGIMMVGASRAQVRQTFQYVAVNGIGSTLFVAGCAFVYATVGTLNMADLSARTAEMSGAPAAIVTASSLVLLVVFALKTAAFPLYFWLPDAYPVVPAGINGFFAGLLTKVGVYSLLRVYVMVFRQEGSELATSLLLTCSGFTMLFGVLGAMCQWEIRRILSWHIISQVGYMVMGIGLASIPEVAPLAIAGTIFYVVHHIVVKSSLFLISGVAERVSGTDSLKSMGGLLDRAPFLAALFVVAAFSLAGMPPFSGFWSKLVLLRAGVLGEAWWVVAASMATSFLTLYSMTKIWSYAFWGESTGEALPAARPALLAPTAVLVAFTVAMGLWAEPVMRIASDAASGLLDPSEYIEAVLRPETTEGQT